MGVDVHEADTRLEKAWAALTALRGELMAIAREVPQVRVSEHWKRICEQSRRVGGDVSAAREALRRTPAPEPPDPDEARELVREAQWASRL